MTTLDAAAIGRIASSAAAIRWRKVALVLLMALPFAVGYTLRWGVRSLVRVVWVLGWLAGWAYYTAAEGWAAAGGKT